MAAVLGQGAYALGRGVARAKVVTVDLRERVLDVAGQEIVTADQVTLRAVVGRPGPEPRVASAACSSPPLSGGSPRGEQQRHVVEVLGDVGLLLAESSVSRSERARLGESASLKS